jgi:hypothetical protein
MPSLVEIHLAVKDFDMFIIIIIIRRNSANTISLQTSFGDLIIIKKRTCCTIWRPFWFAMVAILNQKGPPKYKNPPIWEKFGFQVDFDVGN